MQRSRGWRQSRKSKRGWDAKKSATDPPLHPTPPPPPPALPRARTKKLYERLGRAPHQKTNLQNKWKTSIFCNTIQSTDKTSRKRLILHLQCRFSKAYGEVKMFFPPLSLPKHPPLLLFQVSLVSTYLRTLGMPLIPVLPPHPARTSLATKDPTLGEDVTGRATPLSTKPCANPAKRQIRHQKLSLWEHAPFSTNEPANRWQYVSAGCPLLFPPVFPSPFFLSPLLLPFIRWVSFTSKTVI